LPRAYTATYYEDDARSFTALLHHLITGPAHLVGFSDGGEVELLMAALTPGLARSVVAWGAGGALTEEILPAVEALANIVDDPIPPMQPFREYLVAAYGEANARTTIQHFTGAARAIIEGGGNISLSRAGNISCPVLLLVGEHDSIVSPPLVSNLASRIPNSESVVVEGAGHGVHEDRPGWLVETVLGWLEKH
jgi:valacyclovir hydrolase